MRNYSPTKIKHFIQNNHHLSQAELANELNKAGFTTQRGKPWLNKLVSNFMLHHMKSPRRKGNYVKTDVIEQKPKTKGSDKLALVELIIGLEMPVEQKLNTIKAVLF